MDVLEKNDVLVVFVIKASFCSLINYDIASMDVDKSSFHMIKHSLLSVKLRFMIHLTMTLGIDVDRIV